MAWGVVRAHGGEESRAEENLRRQDYAVFLPRYRERVKRRGRWGDELRVLFPRYLFVEIDGRFRSIFGTRGVADLFMNGDKPAVLRSGEIERMMLAGEGGVLTLPQQGLVGQKVVAIGGPFVDLYGLCEGMSGPDRVAVLFKILGRSVRVTIDRDCVVAA